MAGAQPKKEIEDDQCPVGKIIHKWVRAKREECLGIVDRKEEDFRKNVRQALDELYKDHKIDRLEIGIQAIQYEDPFFQFGYMYRHSMFSARSLSKVMDCSNVLENLEMQNNILTVACLGGGPGSDVLGVLDYFTGHMGEIMGDNEGRLNIQLYDRKDKWGTCWESLKTAMEAELHDPRVRVLVSFDDFDVTKADKNKPDKNKPDLQILQQADVITMHYFMEEVYSERERAEVKECFKYIVQTAKPGALFLYSGMFMYRAIHWVHRLLQDNCELLTPDTEQPGQPQRSYWYQDTSTGPKITKWIPCAEVDLKDEKDLKLFDDIRTDLEKRYKTEEVSQRYCGDVVYRLYKKQ